MRISWTSAAGHGVAAMAVLGAVLVGERLPRVYRPGDAAAVLAVLAGVLLAAFVTVRDQHPVLL